MKIEAWKKHSVGGRFQYPQWKNDVFRVEKYWTRKILGLGLGLGLGLKVSDSGLEGVVSVSNGQVSVLVSDGLGLGLGLGWWGRDSITGGHQLK